MWLIARSYSLLHAHGARTPATYNSATATAREQTESAVAAADKEEKEMKTRTFACMAAIALLALAASPLNAAGRERPSYTVTNLGTAGGSGSAAISITNPHWIAGFSALPGDQTTN